MDYSHYLNNIKKKLEFFNTELEQVIYIRNNVAEFIKVGFGGNDISLFESEWLTWAGKNYFSIFYKNFATVKCGGASHFLKHVYTDLGFKADTYNVGINDPVTHQMTLVFINSINEYVIQDAFFNITFINKYNDEILSFKSLVSLLHNHKHEYIKIQKGESRIPLHWDWSGIDSHFNDDNKKNEFINSGKNFRDFDFFVENIDPLIKAFDPNLSFIDLYLKPLEDNSDEINSIVLNEICE